ncbi:MAG TPA: sugar phosphate isomerase/epimerase [Rectinemataceae bacterium]|nr:sugar phosphate isomerase/epimerase [Rectinemataceae bacterium]
MRLSTSSNIHGKCDGHDSFFGICDSIEACRRAGFGAIDLTLHTEAIGEGRLMKPDWRNWVAEVKEKLAEQEMTARQCHGVYFSNLKPWTPEIRVDYKERIRRCILAAGALGIPWMVTHPICGVHVKNMTEDEIIAKNIAFFGQFEPLMRQEGVGIALENTFIPHFDNGAMLARLADAFSSPLFGTCWDTGHANMVGSDQREDILALGDHLKCLHIADNGGKSDDHLAPYTGTVPWGVVLATLAESGFDGDFTLEVPKMTAHYPASMRDLILKYLVELGERMLRFV